MSKDLVRRDPLEVFAPFFDFGRRWSEVLRGQGEEVGRMIAPAMDVAESADRYTITAELPGLRKDDVKITVENGVLTISGEKKFEREEKKEDYHLVERRYGTFYRSVTLPNQVDSDKASAKFQDGVLVIEVPKLEQAKPRTLKIS